MLLIAVVMIFCATVAAIVWSSRGQARQPRTLLVHRDETTLHHSKNLPGPGAE